MTLIFDTRTRGALLALVLLAATARADAPAPPLGAHDPLPGMPPVKEKHDGYSEARPGHMAGAAEEAVPRVYVPLSKGNAVDVIDPKTYRVVDHFKVGKLPQH